MVAVFHEILLVFTAVTLFYRSSIYQLQYKIFFMFPDILKLLKYVVSFIAPTTCENDSHKHTEIIRPKHEHLAFTGGYSLSVDIKLTNRNKQSLVQSRK